eukprot:Em0019g1134a
MDITYSYAMDITYSYAMDITYSYAMDITYSYAMDITYSYAMDITYSYAMDITYSYAMDITYSYAMDITYSYAMDITYSYAMDITYSYAMGITYFYAMDITYSYAMDITYPMQWTSHIPMQWTSPIPMQWTSHIPMQWTSPIPMQWTSHIPIAMDITYIYAMDITYSYAMDITYSYAMDITSSMQWTHYSYAMDITYSYAMDITYSYAMDITYSYAMDITYSYAMDITYSYALAITYSYAMGITYSYAMDITYSYAMDITYSYAMDITYIYAMDITYSYAMDITYSYAMDITYSYAMDITYSYAMDITYSYAMGITYSYAMDITYSYAMDITYSYAMDITYSYAMGITYSYAMDITYSYAMDITYSYAMDITYSYAMGITYSYAMDITYSYAMDITYSYAMDITYSYAMDITYSYAMDITYSYAMGITYSYAMDITYSYAMDITYSYAMDITYSYAMDITYSYAMDIMLRSLPITHCHMIVKLLCTGDHACAILGLMVVPLAYLTVWELVHSVAAAFLTGVILVCETGTLILSRYILLDPPLIFFVMAATYCTARFRNCNEEPFDLEWWYWLALSGLFLGCAFSVKWVGLFVILLVGLSTAKDLWDLLGNLKLTMLLYGVHERRRGPSCYCDIIHQLRASSLWLPITQSIKPRSLMTLMCITQHLLARVLCLIITPVVVYGSIFVFHFVVLSHSGNGDGFFSSAFQSTLEGNELHDLQVPEYVAYGSTITLKNHRGGGGLLHSHHHLYPEGMGKYQQQQVTAYTHKDDNNKWLVKRAKSSNSTEGEVEFIKHGDWVVLEHITTHRNLHSHTQKAPITESHYQVSCYGQDGVGDTNDYWQVEVDGGSPGDQIKTVTTVLKLRHVNVGCYLHSHGTQLPKWGWEQLEVTCNPQANDRNNLWNVEGNANEKLPMMSFEFYKPSMFSKFIESHLVMAESNNNMKPKEGGDHIKTLALANRLSGSAVLWW